MKLAVVGVVAGLALGAVTEARAETRTLSGLDDARSCALTEGGGVAVATGGGLVLVDAVGRARVLTALDGLPETRVHAVVADGAAVWAGTEAGAARIEGGRVVRAVGKAPVHALAPVDGRVLAGTWGEGLVAIGERVTTLAPVSVAPRVTAIGAEGGRVVVALGNGTLGEVVGGALRVLGGSVSRHVQAVLPIGEGVAAGGLEGLAMGGRDVSSADVRGLAAAGDDVLVATWGQGLLRGKIGARAKLDEVPGLPREVRSVAVRGEGRCVATTSGVWWDRGRGEGFARVALGQSLPSSDVTALAASPSGRVAVGTFDRGAVIASGGATRAVPGLASTETVNALAWEGERLWVATAQGLVRVEADGSWKRFTTRDGLPNAMTRALLVDGDRVVVGTDEGPAVVRGEAITSLAPVVKGRAVPMSSPMHAAWALAKAPDGALLVGTTSGLYRVLGAKVERASVASGALDDDWVTALLVDGTDVLVGTYAHGVTRMALGSIGARDPKVARLGGGYVNPGGLSMEGGRVLVATMDGLLAREGEAWVTALGVAPGRDVTAALRVGREQWVATRRGVAILLR